MPYKWLLALTLGATLTAFGLLRGKHDEVKAPAVYGQGNVAPVQIYTFRPETPVVSEKAPGKLSIRMVILKHAKERMADNDADYAIRSCNKAKNAGLDIKVVGNHFVDNLDHLKRLVDESIRKEAVPGDTFIVHTIGHGFPQGGLQALGARSGVVRVLADAARTNKQEMIWWQLSCHAAASLPAIDTLTPEQQKLFSNLASSSPSQTSPTMEQGGIMEKVFMALAQKNRTIDPNGDGVITAGELKDFLNGIDRRRRGDLFFSRSADEPVFGLRQMNHVLPIIDRNNPQGKYQEDYIPFPGEL